MSSRGSWMKLNCGDRVYDVEDPRHVGTIVSIQHGYEAEIVWIGEGWKKQSAWYSYVPIHKLRKEK